MDRIKLSIAGLMIFLMTACSQKSTPVYWDRAMVEISLRQTGRIDFFIPDQGDSGWNNNDPGQDTVFLDFTVKNLSDVELSLSGIFWGLYCGDDWLWSGDNEIVPPYIFSANDSTTIQVAVVIGEGLAHQIDDSDGLDDFIATGTFKFWMTGYDNEHYEPVGSNYVYAEMSVGKP